MSTTWVVSQCCQAPVRLAFPDLASETAGVVCSRCHAEAGRPGAEDSPEVDEFLRWYATVPVLHATFRRVNPS